MPTFPSSEWIDAFCTCLQAQPGAANAAQRLGGVYRFQIDPAGPLARAHRYQVSLGVGADGAQVARLDDDQVAARVEVRADYPRWQELLRGQLDLTRALLFGRIRISGDLAALMNARSDVDVVVGALRAVDTVWLEQAP